MIGNLRGKVALVTGGAVRIGRAICEALAGEGCDVVVHYRESKREAEEVCGACERRSVRAWSVKADLSDESDCLRLIPAAIKRAGRLDILVNSAAVFHKDKLGDVTADKLLEEFWPDLFAPMLLTKAFAAASKKGRIVNILDRRITGHDTSCVPYLLSKKALAEFMKLAALELAPGFTVNGVAPGPILPPPGKGGSYLRKHAGDVPLDKLFKPEDIAAAVLYLVKNDNLTGQIIYVDGGQHLNG
jgi:hypothetical protein